LSLIGLVIQIIAGIIFVAPSLWLAGRALVGKKAKFSHAVLIVILGVVLGVVIGAVAHSGLLSALISFIVWLGLIKYLFECGWLKALAVAIVAVIIFVIIAIILAVIGIGIVGFGLAHL
jgi:hypothetical protein